MSAVDEVSTPHRQTVGRRCGKQPQHAPSVAAGLPALAFFVAFAFIPLIGVLLLCFTDWDGIGPITFAGFDNWVEVFTDPGTYHALWLTVKLMVITWAIQTPISLLLGVFIAGHQRYRAALAVLYFLPLLLSSAAVAIAFKSLLDPNFGAGRRRCTCRSWPRTGWATRTWCFASWCSSSPGSSSRSTP